ncbi:hypothetical protein HMPREF1020_02287 [Clostridium sp. 7_3_54FAA]|nr:hypothetical protein HMPREF1020_02287 [Clostridium sp. 7_3_54FAA]
MAIASYMIIVILLFYGGILWLQFFLSRKPNRWLGLILPLISFLFSLQALLGIAAYSTVRTSVNTIMENGTSYTTEDVVVPPEKKDTGQLIATAVSVFIEYNIPTVILLGIYAGCRSRRKKNMELEKMNIQDLE